MHAGAGVGAAHVIDHHRQADRFQNRNRLRQILDVDPELKMPSEFGHHGRQRSRRGQRHAAAIMQLPVAEKMIEAQSADTETIPFAQIGRRDVGVGHRDAAQAVGPTLERIEHRGIVAAVRAALHQHAARKSDRVEHAEIFFERRVRRRVAAIVGVRKPRRRSEHMGMGIAGIGRRRHFRPADVARRQAGGNHLLVRHVIRPSCRRPR